MEVPVDDDRLVIRPTTGAAVRWSMAGVLLVVLSAWLALDAGLVGWIALGIATALTGYFVLQLVLPTWFEVVCDDVGIHGRNLLLRLDAPWHTIERADVRTVAGDPVLTVATRGPYETTTEALLLPVGTDLAALRDVLRRRLDAPFGTSPTV
jgi:hypothetical protein